VKILIVGSNKHWATERYFIDHLRELGAEMYQYTAPDIVFDNHAKNLISKVLFKTKIRTGYSEVNRGLLAEAHSLDPDVIWVWKGMEIYPKTLQKLKTRGFKLANFNPDHPFIISGTGSGNKNVTQSVGLFDLHFCYIRKLMQEIENRFHIPTVFLPFAYEKKDVVYIDPASIQEIKRLCFQGNPDKYRSEMILFLAENGFEVDVYGQGWERTRLTNNKNINIFPIVPRPDFWRKNQEYRVQLNLFRLHNKGSHNMRTFEIPAVGGIQLSEYSIEQAEFFTDNEEIFFFRNKNEMVEKADMLLKMNKDRVNKIRTQARERSLHSGYTFSDRAQTVYLAFQKLI
jgi:spore maturation protein CgeB